MKSLKNLLDFEDELIEQLNDSKLEQTLLNDKLLAEEQRSKKLNGYIETQQKLIKKYFDLK